MTSISSSPSSGGVRLQVRGVDKHYGARHVLRHASLVDYAQDGSLRCYYLSRPRLVEDMLALVGRGDPVVKRTPAEIQADKERLAKARSVETTAKTTPRRRKVAS